MPAQELTVMGTKASARYVGLTYTTFKKIVEAGGIKPLVGTKKYRRVDLDKLIGKGGGQHADATGTN